MENLNNRTVIELKALPRIRGMRGYSRLWRAELINLLETPVGRLTYIMDEPVPDINQPTLQPTLFTGAKNFVKSLKDLADKAKEKVMRAASEFANSIMSYIPPPPKPISSVLQWFNERVEPLYRRAIPEPVERERERLIALLEPLLSTVERVTTLERF